MSELPLGWCHVTFDNVIETITNGVNGKQNKDGIGLPVSRIETIANQSIDMERIGFVSDYVEENFKKYRLNEGDILFSHINSPSHLGKTALCGKNIKLFHGVNLLRIVVNGAVTPEFFNFYCKYIRGVGEFSLKAQHAVNQSSLNQQKLKQFILPIAPLNEQIRIANKLDSVLAKVDAAQARLEKIPTLLKRFRQSVLAAATSGELTREWRGICESRDEFLTWKFLNIPSSWEIKLLPEVSEARLGKMLDKNKNQGLPTKYLGNINVRWWSFDLVDLKEILLSEKERIELQIQNGDLLLCEGGEPGRGAIWKNGECDLTFQKALHRVRFNERVLPEFALFCIENDFFQNRLALLYTGTTIKHLTGKALNTYPIPVPPIDEQQEIVRRVESLLALADTVEKQYLAAKQRLDRLSQSILAKAFRGELVPQDPNDEPAAELLKRIKAERQAQPAANRKRSKSA